MVLTVCATCQKLFKINPCRIRNAKRGLVYCNKKCSGLSLVKCVKKKCEQCQKTFFGTPCMMRKRRFCSKECGYSAKRGKPLSDDHRRKLLPHLKKLSSVCLRCKECGQFYRKNHICPGKEELRKRAVRLLQTEESKRKSQITLREIRLDGWISPLKGIPRSEAIKRRISEIKKLQYRLGLHRFNPNIKKGVCLNTGRTHFKKGQFKREKSPHWRGGVTPFRKARWCSVEYQFWRKKVFERDNYACQMPFCIYCNNKRGGCIHAHHIKRIFTNPELIFEVSNGITMCKQFHLEYHKKERRDSNEK